MLLGLVKMTQKERFVNNAKQCGTLTQRNTTNFFKNDVLVSQTQTNAVVLYRYFLASFFNSKYISHHARWEVDFEIKRTIIDRFRQCYIK